MKTVGDPSDHTRWAAYSTGKSYSNISTFNSSTKHTTQTFEKMMFFVYLLLCHLCLPFCWKTIFTVKSSILTNMFALHKMSGAERVREIDAEQWFFFETSFLTRIKSVNKLCMLRYSNPSWIGSLFHADWKYNTASLFECASKKLAYLSRKWQSKCANKSETLFIRKCVLLCWWLSFYHLKAAAQIIFDQVSSSSFDIGLTK